MINRIIKAQKNTVAVGPAMQKLLPLVSSPNQYESYQAQQMIAKALSLPLQDAVLNGSTIDGIFEEKTVQRGQIFMWPISFITGANAGHFDAFVMPLFGRVPDRAVQGDYIMVPVFDVSNGMSVSMSYLEASGWDVMAKLNEVILTGHVRKKNDVGFHTLLTAAAARGFVVTDNQATAGLFTKRLLSVAKTKMTRLGGGNSTSTNQRVLTDVYGSLEMLEDVRSWDLTQIDDVTRRQIYLADDTSEALTVIFGVKLHNLFEFGENQAYQTYLQGTLNQSLSGGDLEFALGLDLRNRDSFIMPVANKVAVYPDPYLHREFRVGLYTRETYGAAVLDNRNCELLSF